VPRGVQGSAGEEDKLRRQELRRKRREEAAKLAAEEMESRRNTLRAQFDEKVRDGRQRLLALWPAQC
jgi:hypothetical protein